MSKQTAELLGAYEALPIDEQQEFVFDVLLRAGKGRISRWQDPRRRMATEITSHPDAGPFGFEVPDYAHEADEGFEEDAHDANVLGIDLASLVPVVAHAVAVFGDEEKASHWLATPLPFFRNCSPIEILGEPGGIHLVEKTLSRIEHNIPS